MGRCPIVIGFQYMHAFTHAFTHARIHNWTCSIWRDGQWCMTKGHRVDVWSLFEVGWPNLHTSIYWIAIQSLSKWFMNRSKTLVYETGYITQFDIYYMILDIKRVCIYYILVRYTKTSWRDSRLICTLKR